MTRTRHRFKIGSVIVTPAPPRPPPVDTGLVCKVVSPKPYSGPFIDHQAEHRRKTRGLKSSRQIRAEAERAATAARVAVATAALLSQVQSGFRPPRGRLWSVDLAAQIIMGPAGGIGTTPVIARTLQTMSGSGRHDEAAVAVAAGWRDVTHLREAFQALAPKLAAVGLRIDRRKAGIRVTRVRAPASEA